MSRCFDCGREVDKLHTHHLDGVHGKINPELTIECCVGCHRKRHSGPSYPAHLILPTDKIEEYKKKRATVSSENEVEQELISQEYKGKLATLKDKFEEKIRNLNVEFHIDSSALPPHMRAHFTDSRLPMFTYPRPLYTLEIFSSLREETEEEIHLITP